VQASVVRGRHFGSESWQEATAKQLGLEFPFRPRGRPEKKIADSKSLHYGPVPFFSGPLFSDSSFAGVSGRVDAYFSGSSGLLDLVLVFIPCCSSIITLSGIMLEIFQVSPVFTNSMRFVATVTPGV
jgi:hypothetical protein